MKNYAKRGMTLLTVSICTFAGGILLCFFPQTRYTGIALMIVSLVYLPAFFVCRSMTPEQYEKQRKKEQMANDERSQQIGARTSQLTVMVMYISLCAGVVVSLIAGNDSALYANLGQFCIIEVSAIIINIILKRKM